MVTSLAWSPCGRVLVTGSSDGSAKLWDWDPHLQGQGQGQEQGQGQGQGQCLRSLTGTGNAGAATSASASLSAGRPLSGSAVLCVGCASAGRALALATVRRLSRHLLPDVADVVVALLHGPRYEGLAWEASAAGVEGQGEEAGDGGEGGAEAGSSVCAARDAETKHCGTAVAAAAVVLRRAAAAVRSRVIQRCTIS